MLTINAATRNLLIPAKVQLSTWCRSKYEEGCIADVLWLNEDTKSWETIHSCELGVSRVIKFDTTHTGSMFAVSRLSRRLEHAISLIFYFWQNLSAVAVMLDTPLAVMRSRRNMEKRIHTDVKEFPLDVLFCDESDRVNLVYKFRSRGHIRNHETYETFVADIIRMESLMNISTVDKTAQKVEFRYSRESNQSGIYLSGHSTNHITSTVR